MTYELACPGCGRGLELPDLPAGARIRCPACSHVFVREEGRGVTTTSRVPSLALGPGPSAGGAVPDSSVRQTSENSPAPPTPTARAPRWQLRTPEGLVFGPVDRAQLDQWVREGRVTADCQVRDEVEDQWHAADEIYPALIERTPSGVADPRLQLPVSNSPESGVSPRGPSAGSDDRVVLRPHRGPLILTLALVGLLVQCPIFSVLAWVMGSSDLEEIYVGRMDPEGLKATRAGRMLGMIMSLFWIIMAVVLVSIFVLVVAVR